MIIENPAKIKKADLVVGIPSYCEAKTISFVVEQASLGLKKYFPEYQSVIINVDNNSPDGTKEAFFKAQSEVPKIYVSSKEGLKGKGYNFYNLFLMMEKLNTSAAVVLDADLRSMRGLWIKKMLEPIFKGYDFISPYYIRCKTDATITNNLAYPLICGALGLDLRQPIGGDFAFSRRMVRKWLKGKWERDTYGFGIDIYMSLNAFFQKAKMAQVNLGSKIHNLSNPKLGPMFSQVATTLFKILLAHKKEIKRNLPLQKIKILGGRKLPLMANAEPAWELFNQVFLNHLEESWPVIEKTVSPSVKKRISQIYQQKESLIDLELWLKIVYDFVLGYQREKSPQIIKALGCLYFGRAASFFKENMRLTPEEVEKKVTKTAYYFYQHRDYLVSKLK